jgi:hypothetical protein
MQTVLLNALSLALLGTAALGSSELEFKDGAAAVSITYNAAGGLLIPGYAKKEDVTALTTMLEATLRTYVDGRVDTLQDDVDTTATAAQTKLEFTEGGSSTSITYDAAGGLQIPGYVKTSDAITEARVEEIIASTVGTMLTANAAGVLPGCTGTTFGNQYSTAGSGVPNTGGSSVCRLSGAPTGYASGVKVKHGQSMRGTCIRHGRYSAPGACSYRCIAGFWSREINTCS